MPIYKVTSSYATSYGTVEEASWGDNDAVIVRAIDNLEAIDIAMTDYGSERWTRANCSAEVISEQGKSEFILRDNRGE